MNRLDDESINEIVGDVSVLSNVEDVKEIVGEDSVQSDIDTSGSISDIVGEVSLESDVEGFPEIVGEVLIKSDDPNPTLDTKIEFRFRELAEIFKLGRCGGVECNEIGLEISKLPSSSNESFEVRCPKCRLQVANKKILNTALDKSCPKTIILDRHQIEQYTKNGFKVVPISMCFQKNSGRKRILAANRTKFYRATKQIEKMLVKLVSIEGYEDRCCELNQYSTNVKKRRRPYKKMEVAGHLYKERANEIGHRKSQSDQLKEKESLILEIQEELANY